MPLEDHLILCQPYPRRSCLSLTCAVQDPGASRKALYRQRTQSDSHTTGAGSEWRSATPRRRSVSRWKVCRMVYSGRAKRSVYTLRHCESGGLRALLHTRRLDLSNARYCEGKEAAILWLCMAWPSKPGSSMRKSRGYSTRRIVRRSSRSARA